MTHCSTGCFYDLNLSGGRGSAIPVAPPWFRLAPVHLIDMTSAIDEKSASAGIKRKVPEYSEDSLPVNPYQPTTQVFVLLKTNYPSPAVYIRLLDDQESLVRVLTVACGRGSLDRVVIGLKGDC